MYWEDLATGQPIAIFGHEIPVRKIGVRVKEIIVRVERNHSDDKATKNTKGVERKNISARNLNTILPFLEKVL